MRLFEKLSTNDRRWSIVKNDFDKYRKRRQSRPIDGVGLRARKTAGFFVIAS